MSLDEEYGAAMEKAVGKMPFGSVDELREAIRKSSPETDWRAYKRTVERTEAWYSLPFHTAWNQVNTYGREYCDLLAAASSLNAYGCGSVSSTSRGRFVHEQCVAHRTALSCVVALNRYKGKHGHYPPALENLVSDFLQESPVDPFSGKPMIYRTTNGGDDFQLYSVGADQVDGGGTTRSSDYEPGDYVFWPPHVPEIKRN